MIIINGCATLTKPLVGGGYGVTFGKELKIRTSPSDATVVVYSKTGKIIPQTRSKDKDGFEYIIVKLNGSSPFTIEVSANDYLKTTIKLKRRFNHFYWLNIPFLIGGVGLVGIVLDPILGNTVYLPVENPYYIGLQNTPEYLAQKAAREKIADEERKIAAEKKAAEKKVAINKLVAENPQLYPSPFEGIWICKIPGTPDRTETYYTTEDNSSFQSGYYQNYPNGGGRYIPGTYHHSTKQVPHTRTIPGTPAITMYLVFNGKNYTIEKQIGTFFYNGKTIELDNGTILELEVINNKVILKSGNKLFEKQ